ncbi:hypothetical protein bas25_0060 [Escherichia phage VogelGryff]|nr:hypothetical protein bas25_0060 [Escherichia phage VogelGryff]
MNIKDFPVLPRVMPSKSTSTYFRIGFILEYQLSLLNHLTKELEKLKINNIGQLRKTLRIKHRISELNKCIAQLSRYRTVVKFKL